MEITLRQSISTVILPPRQIDLLYAAVGDFDSTVFEIPSAVETNDIFVTDTLRQSGQSLLLYPVVAIDKPYVPTTSSPKPRITCPTEPSVLLSDYLYLVAFTRILFEYGRAAVGTAVVDTNDFVFAVVTLIKHRIQALRQISLDIINGNNDRKFHNLSIVNINIILLINKINRFIVK